MAAPLSTGTSAGFRALRVYALNAFGIPDAPVYTTATPNGYEGVLVTGSKALEITIPDSRVIGHQGDDGITQVQVLPPNSVANGSVKTDYENHALDALLSGTKSFVVGESPGLIYGSEKQGYEAQVAALAYNAYVQSNGTNGFRVGMTSRATLIPKPKGMAEGALDNSYTFVPNIFAQHIWGTALTEATEGCLHGQWEQFITVHRPHIITWKQVATSTPEKFKFPTDKPATAVLKIHALVLCTIATGVFSSILGTATLAVDGVTPATIASGDLVTAYYEYL